MGQYMLQTHNITYVYKLHLMRFVCKLKTPSLKVSSVAMVYMLGGEDGAGEGAVVKGSWDRTRPPEWLHPLDTVARVLRGKYLQGSKRGHTTVHH